MYFYIGGVGFLKPFDELTTCFHKFSEYESMNFPLNITEYVALLLVKKFVDSYSENS